MMDQSKSTNDGIISGRSGRPATTAAGGSDGGGTSVPFWYSKSELGECSSLMSGGCVTTAKQQQLPDSSLGAACLALYRDFLLHYHPSKARLWDEEEIAVARDSVLGEGKTTTTTESAAVAAEEASYAAVFRLFPDSFGRFLETVRLVHEHNNGRAPSEHHTLRINQFADRPSPFAGQQRGQNAPQQQQPWQVRVDEIWEAHEASSAAAEHDGDGRGDGSGEGPSERRRNLRRHDDDELWHGLDFATLLGSPESILLLRDGGGGRGNNDSGEKRHERSLQSEHTASSASASAPRQRSLTAKNTFWKRPKQQKAHDKNHKKEKENTISSYYATSTKLSAISTESMFTKVDMPGDGTDAPKMFACPKVPANIDGIVVELYKGMPLPSQPQKQKGRTTGSKSTSPPSWSSHFFHRPVTSETRSDNDDLHGSDGGGDAATTDDAASSSAPPNHPFRTSLNWATTHNPDGVPLVHPAFDQGSCGSCWAFAATGSVEASAARNAAREYFVEALVQSEKDSTDEGLHYEDLDTTDESSISGSTSISDETKNLTVQTQLVEMDTFARTDLSIQQLLDCDVASDQGCTGGNPLLAFFFIHRYGLVPWDEYPYAGYYAVAEGSDRRAPDHSNSSSSTTNGEKQGLERQRSRVRKTPFTTKVADVEMIDGVCQADKMANPVATVQSWGLLHKNYEDLIELALLYVGPVAVGMNGADPAFIHYGGGIFDSPDCEQGANHALLIVGYDQEDIMGPDGQLKPVRYWIARNSWGTGWGENGFVKIKRGSGRKKVPGVCGIARSPSVALGGQLRLDRYAPLLTSKPPPRYHGDDTSYSEANQVRQDHDFCDSVLPVGSAVYKGCIKVSNIYDDHPGIFLGVLSILFSLLAIVPLTSAIIKRRSLGSSSLSLESDGQPYDAPSRRRSRSSMNDGLEATETTHLLTVKDMYASMQMKNGTKTTGTKPKGRFIVMKRPEQDPFRLSGSITISDVPAKETVPADTS